MMRASSIAHRLVNEARRAQGEHGVSRYTHCMRRTVDAFEQFGINIHADFFFLGRRGTVGLCGSTVTTGGAAGRASGAPEMNAAIAASP